MSYPKRILSPLLIIAMLVMQLMSPVPALAEGETPPETSQSTEEVTPPEAETPQESTDSIEEPDIETEEGSEKEETTDVDSSSEVAQPEPEPDLTVAEVLEQAPEGTGIVVVNAEGEVEPLATEAAAEIVAAADPIWCPDGVAPIANTGGCTASYTKLKDLLDELDTSEVNNGLYDEAGTIWIEDSYVSSTNDPTVSGFTIDGAAFSIMRDNALTIQGGWSGVSGSTAITGTSLFDEDYLHIVDWNADVTLNDIVVDGVTTNDGIKVETAGDINLKNVTSSNNTDGTGAVLDNISSSTNANINLTGTNVFNGNDDYGLLVSSRGDITLNNITASNNVTTDGAFLNNTLGTGNISLTGTNVFNGNYYGYGLYATSKGDITLNNVTASNNNHGALFFNSTGTGNISLTGTNVFNGNSYFGLVALSKGDITLNNVTASNNVIFDGAFLDNSRGTGNIISLTGTNVFNGNNAYGLEALSDDGAITLENVTANFNGKSGIKLETSANAAITTATFNCNAMFGIDANSVSGSLTLNTVSIGSNGSGPYTFSGTPTLNNVLIEAVDCNPSDTKKTVVVVYPSKPIHEVAASNGATELDCDQYKGTSLNLPNGDFAYFPCPIQGSASLSSLEPENLPNGISPHSGFTTAVTQGGNAKTVLSKYMTISFEIPAGADVSSLAIMYWDGSAWVELSNNLDLGGGKLVGLGGFLNPDGTHFQATVNFTGGFILVSK